MKLRYNFNINIKTNKNLNITGQLEKNVSLA